MFLDNLECLSSYRPRRAKYGYLLFHIFTFLYFYFFTFSQLQDAFRQLNEYLLFLRINIGNQIL